MVKVTLLCQCYVYCYHCLLQWMLPIFSVLWGRDIGHITLCVFKCDWKVLPKSFKKEWDLKVTCAYHLYIQPVLFCSMLCFSMETLPVSLKKQTFSSHEETWILHVLLDTECKTPSSFSEYCMGLVSSGASHGQW